MLLVPFDPIEHVLSLSSNVTAKATQSVNKERNTRQPSVKANSGHEAAFAFHSVAVAGRNTFPVQKI